ncbi:flagellar hook capping FlgD N-terminal domain-containing protein [Amnibacterium sp. CER49]|uniref:flagellar hook capping FlgD N-terminal domain-containing protein n=1 Tax=Amnibacterium sp. CER49 TaxID=3039161 RepID=UPI0024480044|nr:flagellar hook capping FlgD N-terminal domain-containing protein [Amnibacterium sp. CER49]MDH2443861.1 flagellar hook capping FlgD N-terminal domain-containing protein [Amnibacterium sp. CER49]
MTSVTPATAAPAASSIYTSATSKAKPNQTMDSQMFLKLLTTQLRNQDPSSPMDSGQMISQTSQLASMEQLTNLSSATTNSYDLQMRSAAANVLGKQVTWTGADGSAQSGTVTAVGFTGTTPTLTVGSATVSLSEVTGVTETGSASAA